MGRYTHTVEIACPRDRVFAFVTDPANYERWQPSLVRVEPDQPGALQEGSTATEVRRFLGREVTTRWRCTEHRPVSRSTIEAPQATVPFRGIFDLEDRGGRTRFTWTVETWGTAARLGGPMVGRATTSEMKANASRLKRLLEAER